MVQHPTCMNGVEWPARQAHGGDLVEVILRSEKDSRSMQLELWRLAEQFPTQDVQHCIRGLGVHSKIIDPSITENGSSANL